MRHRHIALLACVLVAATAAPGAAARAAAQTPADYTIGADDVLDVTLVNHPELNRTVTVLSDGTIDFPAAGRLHAAGMTPQQLAEAIKTGLERTKNNVVVSVTVRESHSRRIRIVGSVKTPNAYDLKPRWRLLDVVAVAGGLSARPAHLSGRLIRSNGAVMPLNVPAAITDPASSANPELQPDDLIVLDEADPAMNKVYVMGQVAKPGAYDLGDEGISVLSLLSQAGNTTDQAALTRAYIMRGKTEIPLNLRSTLIEGKPDPQARSLTMQAGDVLFIPEIDKRVAVMGQVNKPGYYPLSEARDITALDALSLAGGQTQSGDLGKAGIIRLVNGKPQVIPVNVEKMLKRGDLAKNVTLQPEDVLYIPARGDRAFTWADILSPISTLAYVGLRLIGK